MSLRFQSHEYYFWSKSEVKEGWPGIDQPKAARLEKGLAESSPRSTEPLSNSIS